MTSKPTNSDLLRMYVRTRNLRAVYEAGVAAERERVVELAARRAEEGYRRGENCDDIARDIRAIREEDR